MYSNYGIVLMLHYLKKWTLLMWFNENLEMKWFSWMTHVLTKILILNKTRQARGDLKVFGMRKTPTAISGFAEVRRELCIKECNSF